MKIETKFNINQEVWFIRGDKNKRIDKCKIYGYVNDNLYRLKSHGKHLTKDIGKIFATQKEAETKLKEKQDEE
jgi:hypothetical protein